MIKYGDSIKAKSREELFKILKTKDIYVPPRQQGRKTEHCETWVICKLLATLAENNKLDFPLELIKGERPDFFLCTRKCKIGIEITEAINESLARALSILESQDFFIIDLSYFKWNTHYTNNELREILSRKINYGPGFYGDSAEKDYADAICHIIRKKTKKFQKTGFEKFEHNWLVIYDNHGIPGLNINKANKILMEKLVNYWKENCFTDILVEKGKNFIWYNSEQFEILEVPNL